MKAWEVRSSVLGLRDVESPALGGAGTVIQIRYVGICGSDVAKLLHPNDFALPDPWRPGHEIVGTDLGGRWVAIDPLVPCRHCSRCATGDTHLCPDLLRIGWDLPGGFAEQVLVPVTSVHAVPDGLDPLHAVLADPAAVAVHGIRCSPVAANARLAIVGAGTVGLLTALHALASGHDVTVVHRGGHAPGPATVRAIPAAFRSPPELAAGDTFDAVVDAANGQDAAPLELALHLVRDGGMIVVQNAYHPDVCLQTPLREIFRRSIRLVGSFSYCRRNRQTDFDIALALLRDHAQQVNHLVVKTGQLVDLGHVLACGAASPTRHVLAA